MRRRVLDILGHDRSVETSAERAVRHAALQDLENPVSSKSRYFDVTHHDWSDGDLVAAVVARQEDAFAELFRRHHRSVTASSRMIIGNGPECDDVTADVFIGFWRHPEKFDASRGALLSYLRIQAKSRSIDLIRAESARASREKSDRHRVTILDADVGSEVLALEEATQLRRAISFLPHCEREPIELAYFMGMTYSEVAHQLDVAEGTVKSRIRKGLQRLRSMYDAQSRFARDGAVTLGETDSIGQLLNGARLL